MAVIFIVSTVVLGGTLWLALPTLELFAPFCLASGPFMLTLFFSLRDDRPLLRLPKSFAQLQDLNYLLKKYRDIYPFRIFVSYVTTYLLYDIFLLWCNFLTRLPFAAAFKLSRYLDPCIYLS